jgi:hypothetical protein
MAERVVGLLMIILCMGLAGSMTAQLANAAPAIARRTISLIPLPNIGTTKLGKRRF